MSPRDSVFFYKSVLDIQVENIVNNNEVLDGDMEQLELLSDEEYEDGPLHQLELLSDEESEDGSLHQVEPLSDDDNELERSINNQLLAMVESWNVNSETPSGSNGLVFSGEFTVNCGLVDLDITTSSDESESD